jgi:pyruvate dehydrogenase (quinone)
MSVTVSDFLLQRITEWGIHRIYGYPGDGINGIIGAVDRANGEIQYIQVRHEEMAAFMACAHAKFTGEDKVNYPQITQITQISFWDGPNRG